MVGEKVVGVRADGVMAGANGVTGKTVNPGTIF